MRQKGYMEEANVSDYQLSFIHQQAYQIQLDWLIVTQVIVVPSTSLLFVYVNGVMFFTLRSKPIFKETSRYILFSNMVFSDSILLMSSTVLYSIVTACLFVSKAVCALVMLFSIITYTSNPLNLAVMSLERYVAICFPLRHAEIATQSRTYIAIGVVWFLSSLNFIIDMFYMAVIMPHSFTTPVFCTREGLFVAKWQADSYQVFNSLYLVAVTVIIIFTYVAIVVTARSVSSDQDSARKARNTVLLHLIQMGLCLTSFLYSIFERLLSTISVTLFLHLRVLFYVILLILPRCLSPLIYGLRDDTFRPLFLSYFRCRTREVKPAVLLH